MYTSPVVVSIVTLLGQLSVAAVDNPPSPLPLLLPVPAIVVIIPNIYKHISNNNYIDK
jgi:hypothetical protein